MGWGGMGTNMLLLRHAVVFFSVLMPSMRTQYTLGYGGGAVCGDQVTITCHVDEGSTAALTTQGSTKVRAASPDRKSLKPTSRMKDENDSYLVAYTNRCFSPLTYARRLLPYQQLAGFPYFR